MRRNHQNLFRRFATMLLMLCVLLFLGVLVTGCATQRYDTGITVNCGAGGAQALAQKAAPAKQETKPLVTNDGARCGAQAVTAPQDGGPMPTVLIVQNVSGNEGSTSRSTLMDWLRNLFQGAELPTAIGQTPTSTLNSTGKTQMIDNSAKPATTGGDGKTTPGATAPGG